MKQLTQEVTEIAGETIRTFAVLDEGVPESLEVDLDRFIDFKKELHVKRGAENGSILLLRPDGYVAIHLQR